MSENYKIVDGRIQHKNDIEANWKKAVNFVPLEAEIIIYLPDETHKTARHKVGDGVTKINDLPFANEVEGALWQTGNEATNVGTVAFGSNTKAGSKGFTVTAVVDNGDGTGKYTLSSVTGLEVGMSYSVALRVANYNAGTITAINGNVVTVDGYKHIELNSNTDNVEEYNVYNVFFVVGRPDLGDKEIGFNAQAEGDNTCAHSRASHVEGSNTIGLGQFSHAEGQGTMAGHAAHAEGDSSRALGDSSHAEGFKTEAKGDYSHAEGNDTTAQGEASHSEGDGAIAIGWAAHAEGRGLQTKDRTIEISGITVPISLSDLNIKIQSIDTTKRTITTSTVNNILITKSIIEEILSQVPNGRCVIRIAPNKESGVYTYIPINGYEIGETGTLFKKPYLVLTVQDSYDEEKNLPLVNLVDYAIIDICQGVSYGEASHIEGYGNLAFADYAHVEGMLNVAEGANAHAEGKTTKALGESSHTEGYATTTSEYYAHAEGKSTTASGQASHSEGKETAAKGHYSHAEGSNSSAEGENSHSEGAETLAKGTNAHSEGGNTQANGANSHAEGKETVANGYGSHAEGGNTTAQESYTHAEGRSTTASAQGAHAEGYSTIASGQFAHAEGNGTSASGYYAHAEGTETQASSDNAHAEGQGTVASKDNAHAEGQWTVAPSKNAHAEGYQSKAEGENAHAEGSETIASGINAHTEGGNTQAIGNNSHAEGKTTTASGYGAHAEGGETVASQSYAHAEGYQSKAENNSAHAEGYMTQATEVAAHSEGYGTTASARYSHAEGLSTKAFGQSSHAEGEYTKASGNYSHAGGAYTVAFGDRSFAHGLDVIANGENSFAIGQYGEVNENAIFSVGTGENSSARSNAFEIDYNGNIYAKRMIYIGGAGATKDRAREVVTADQIELKLIQTLKNTYQFYYYKNLAEAVNAVNSTDEMISTATEQEAYAGVYKDDAGIANIIILRDMDNNESNYYFNVDVKLNLGGKRIINKTSESCAFQFNKNAWIDGTISGSSIISKSNAANAILIKSETNKTFELIGGYYEMSGVNATNACLLSLGCRDAVIKDAEFKILYGYDADENRAINIKDNVKNFTMDHCNMYVRSIAKTLTVLDFNGELGTISNTKIHSVIQGGGVRVSAGIEQNNGRLYLNDVNVFCDAPADGPHGTYSTAFQTGKYSNVSTYITGGSYYGTCYGLRVLGNTYIKGGYFTSSSHGGIYFSRNNDLYVQDAVIGCVSYNGEFGSSGMTNGQLSAFYIGGGSSSAGSNNKVYMDNCTLLGGGYSGVLRGTDGEKNNILYLSNTVIPEGKRIRVDAGNYVVAGEGTNLTIDNVVNIHADPDISGVSYTNDKYTYNTHKIAQEMGNSEFQPISQKAVTERLGDVETALDRIIEIQNTLMGGNA